MSEGNMKTWYLLFASVFCLCLVSNVVGFDNPFDSETYTKEQCKEKGQICNDLIEQYKIVKRSGSAVETCARAGVVKQYFLSIKDEKNYRIWQNVEQDNCEQAGTVAPKK
jgi:hypothetical protein